MNDDDWWDWLLGPRKQKTMPLPNIQKLSNQAPSSAPQPGAQSNGILGQGYPPGIGGTRLDDLYLAQLYALYGLAAGSGPATVKRPEPDPEPERGGTVFGEILGHRCWYVRDGFLTSFSAGAIWAPDEPMTAESGVQIVEGRGKGEVGIHAFKLQREALKFAAEHCRTELREWDAYRNAPRVIAKPVVYGRVHLWGDVIEHELGYRAEFARIEALDGLYFGEADLVALRARYCPVPNPTL